MRTHRYCYRCGTEVRRETKIKPYKFYCPNCDENMFGFEVLTKKFMKALKEFEKIKKQYLGGGAR